MILTTKTKVALLSAIFVFINVILESCCREDHKLSNITRFFAIDSADPFPVNEHITIDTIRNDFSLVLYFSYTIAKLNTGFINSAYALQCSPNILNEILQDRIQLTNSQAFNYDGKTVPAGTNILELEGIEIKYVEPETGSQPTLYIQFTSKFMDRASFLEDFYSFYVTVPTNDALIFHEEAVLYMLDK